MSGTLTSAMPQAGVQLVFKGLPEAPLLAGSSHIVQLLEKHFQRWPFELAPAGEERPAFAVRTVRRGFQVSSREGGAELFETAAEMLCDLGIDLAEAAVRNSAGTQCLHCAAVALPCGGGEKLAVFPNVNKAGKSLLAACFLRHGARLFADDLLAVTEGGEGMAFGLPPRLRLPLPESASHLAAAMRGMPGYGDGRYHFLYAGESLAGFGEALPVGAIVLPRRREEKGALPELHRLSASSALQCLTYQFQMRDGQAQAVLELARRLCERLPLWILDYDSPEEAASLVVQEAPRLFSPASPGEEDAGLAVDFLAESDRLSCARAARGRAFPSERNLRWHRAPGVRIYENGAFAYLIPKEQSSIFGVDGIGRAVFALLAEPLSIAEAAGLLAEIFPQTGRSRLESDLSHFFRTLFEQGLIVRAPC